MWNVFHVNITRKNSLHRTLALQMLKPTTDNPDPMKLNPFHIQKIPSFQWKGSLQNGRVQRLYHLTGESRDWFTKWSRVISHLWIIPRLYTTTEIICSLMFTVLLTIARKWKTLRCPPTDEQWKYALHTQWSYYSPGREKLNNEIANGWYWKLPFWRRYLSLRKTNNAYSLTADAR